MDEMVSHPWQVFNDKYAVVLNHTTFRWEKEEKDSKNGKGNKKQKGK